MKIFHNFGEFLDVTHPLRFEEFDDLEIKPHRRMGIFHPTQFSELIEFCKANTEYHVMSGFYKRNQLLINAPVPGATQYYLCSGDANPELVWFPAVTEERRKMLKIAEFNVDK